LNRARFVGAVTGVVEVQKAAIAAIILFGVGDCRRSRHLLSLLDEKVERLDVLEANRPQ
jgi:hypothetical protein